MDEKAFKKHLKDLAEGHHHPDEHDWDAASATAPRPKVKRPAKVKPAAKRSAKSAKPRKRSAK